MQVYRKQLEIRWADLDPNFHVRHSVYYDWGAYCRMCLLTENAITPKLMSELNFGPILFREECVFRKEIHFGDQLSINLQLIRAKSDFTRWSFRHELLKNETELAAVITVDGAWIDTIRRRLASPPAVIGDCFRNIPQSTDFEWINK
jgi:acyl-CoA thioester hydrolase